MMPPAAFIAALASQGAETAGAADARLLLGTADEIISGASTLRVNCRVATSLAEATGAMASLVSSIVLDISGTDLDVHNMSAFETFSLALQEIQSAIQAQKDQTYLFALLHQQRDKKALEDLSQRLHAAFDVLMASVRIHAATEMAARMADFDALATKRRAQLDALSPLPNTVYAPIPPAPQLHVGRAAETQAVVQAITREDRAGRVAILGGPGIGKTSVAAAALHHPAVTARFGARRFFVPCDSAEGRSGSGCLASVTDAFGVAASNGDSALRGLRDALGDEPAVLVLDNFESAWEDVAQRSDSEQVLAFLNGMENLAVIITMRGSERPLGLSWTRPFLDPLAPLSEDGGRQVFLSIANIDEQEPDLDLLLQRLDNLPLALVLMATLAQYSTIRALLVQWDETATAMLVRGASSLDVSINTSLRSPRMQAVPDAQILLGALSLLPSGAMDTDMTVWSSELAPGALSMLLRTALATQGADGRVRVLAPIRSFIRLHYPPSDMTACVSSAMNYYLGLAHIAQDSFAELSPETLALIAPELANIHSVTRFALESTDTPGAALETVKSLCSLHMRVGMGTGPELLPLACATAERHGLDDVRARLLHQWGVTSFNSAVPGDPASLYRQAHDIFSRIDNTAGIIDTGRSLSRFLPPPQAALKLDSLYRLAESLRDSMRMASCAEALARALERSGRPREAIIHYERAIAHAQPDPTEPSAHIVVGASLQSLGDILMQLGDCALASEKYQEALAVFERAPFRTGQCNVHMQLSEFHLMRGDPGKAIEHAAKAIALHYGADFRHKPYCLMLIVQAHMVAGSTEKAREALENLRNVPQTQFERTHVVRLSGILAHHVGDLAEAEAFLRAACVTARNADIIQSPEDMMFCHADCLLALSAVERAKGQLEHSAVSAVAAAVIFRSVGVMMASAASLVLLSEAVDDDFAELLLDAVAVPLLRLGDAVALAKASLRAATIAFHRGNRRLARHHASQALERLRSSRDKAVVFNASLIISSC